VYLFPGGTQLFVIKRDNKEAMASMEPLTLASAAISRVTSEEN